MLKKNRPRFLDLWRIRLPLTGMVSLLHRVSGVIMVLLFPFLLYLLQLSLSGGDGFALAAAIVGDWPGRILGLLLLWLFAHHLFAGIRVVLIDMEWGSELTMARRSARLVLLAALLVVLVGSML
jgi:succinate dehydrogenase / fumarate reductase cytochrome b subunit